MVKQTQAVEKIKKPSDKDKNNCKQGCACVRPLIKKTKGQSGGSCGCSAGLSLGPAPPPTGR
jgi:hypothetical protein